MKLKCLALLNKAWKSGDSLVVKIYDSTAYYDIAYITLDIAIDVYGDCKVKEFDGNNVSIWE